MSDRSEANRVSDDLVERMARAMWEAVGADPHDFWADDFRAYECQARAAIALALEEAAKMAESFTTPFIASDFGTVIVDQGGEIAAAIRALIPKENF